MSDSTRKDVYYPDYLGLDKILNAQFPESDHEEYEAHDEMLFIIVHQAYELWFKQIIHELGSILKIFGKPSINDNSGDLQIVVHRMRRIVTILRLLVQQINVMETMTPLDFLDFRSLLRPASGFQSVQFKVVEAALGLKLEHRHARKYYLSQLKPEHIAKIQAVEEQKSLVELVNEWLERMPYFDNDEYWNEYKAVFPPSENRHVFWNDYRELYSQSLVEGERNNIHVFDKLFFEESYNEERRFSARANRAALFIMLYRDFPLLQLPYQLFRKLLDIDELLSTWRYRHMNMVHRMIGKRVGTGGSSGKDYLKASLEKHYVFKEIAELITFLIERRNLPKLDKDLVAKLGY